MKLRLNGPLGRAPDWSIKSVGTLLVSSEVILEHIWNINKVNNGQSTQNNLILDHFDVREGYKFRLILGHIYMA